MAHAFDLACSRMVCVRGLLLLSVFEEMASLGSFHIANNSLLFFCQPAAWGGRGAQIFKLSPRSFFRLGGGGRAYHQKKVSCVSPKKKFFVSALFRQKKNVYHNCVTKKTCASHRRFFGDLGGSNSGSKLLGGPTVGRSILGVQKNFGHFAPIIKKTPRLWPPIPPHRVTKL